MSLTIATAASNAVRDAHYESGVRSLLIEGSRTNLVPWSQDFSHWTPIGTPTRTPAALTLGALTLDLLGDDDGGTLEGYLEYVAFTGDGTKAFSFHIAQGTSTGTEVEFYDITANASRGRVFVGWAGGAPVFNVTGGATVLRSRLLSSGVYAVWCSCSGIVAANTNQIIIYPSNPYTGGGAATTGTVYCGGVQAEDAPFPSSYIVTSGAPVTRAADSLVLPFNLPPQEMTVYLKFVERGSYQTVGRLITLGSASDAGPRLLVFTPTANQYQVYHQNASGGTPVTSTVSSLAPTFGDLVELRAILYADGSVQLYASKNGGAEIGGTRTSASPLAAAWQAKTLALGFASGTAAGFTSFQAIRVIPGIQTLADCRATHGGILT